MAEHKFKVGQLVDYSPGRKGFPASARSCKILRVLPAEDGQPQYRIKCLTETLERVTDSATNAATVRPALGPAIDAGLKTSISDAELRTHPLAIWVETRLGVTWSEVDQRWVRARPLTVTEAVAALSEDAGRDGGACRAALRDLLLLSTVPEVNPDFANYNHVFLHYCSSDAYAGDTQRRIGAATWQFRGREIVDAMLDQLSAPSDATAPSLKNATEVLVTGSSAGAMGVASNLDRMAGREHDGAELGRTGAGGNLEPRHRGGSEARALHRHGVRARRELHEAESAGVVGLRRPARDVLHGERAAAATERP